MTVREFLAQVRNTLNDRSKTFWDDSELLDYYNECVLSITAERLENKTVATMPLTSGKYEYDTTGIIRYISAKDDEDNERALYPDDGTGEDDSSGIIILDYNRVKVNYPDKGSSITFKIVAQPNEQNLTDTVRTGDEQALKYYILSKAYEQDLDVQDLQKSDYFYGKYKQYLEQLVNASSANYRSGHVPTTKSYYF